MLPDRWESLPMRKSFPMTFSSLLYFVHGARIPYGGQIETQMEAGRHGQSYRGVQNDERRVCPCCSTEEPCGGGEI